MLSLSGAPERLILFIESFRVLGDRVESQGKMKRLWQHAFPLPGPAAWLHGSTGIFFSARKACSPKSHPLRQLQPDSKAQQSSLQEPWLWA